MTEHDLREIAQALNQLAPGSASAHCAASILEFNDWNFPLAENSSLQAIEADPGYELGHTWRAYILLLWRRTDEAREQLKLSQALAPSKATVFCIMAHTYYADRNFTNAIEWYRKTLEWDSHHIVAYNYLGRAYLALGEYVNAIENFQTAALLNSNDPSAVSNYFGRQLRIYSEGGSKGYWENEWRTAEKDPNTTSYAKAAVRIHLGDTNSALSWLEKSYETHEHEDDYETPLVYLLFDKCWDGLRDVPRFQMLLQKVGFTRMMPLAQS